MRENQKGEKTMHNFDNGGSLNEITRHYMKTHTLDGQEYMGGFTQEENDVPGADRRFDLFFENADEPDTLVVVCRMSYVEGGQRWTVEETRRLARYEAPPPMSEYWNHN
jgi:hypothetical protein